MIKNKIAAYSLIVALLAGFVMPARAADVNTNLGSDYAVYVFGSDDPSKTTLNLEKSTTVEGNAIVQAGMFRLEKTWDKGNIINGKLYPAAGVTMDTSNLSDWAINTIKGFGTIAPKAEYTAEVPTPENKTVPELQKRTIPAISNGVITISESGWYDQSLTVRDGTNVLTLDTTGKEILRIHIKQLTVNGKINIKGNGRVFLYVDSFSSERNSFINSEGSDANQFVLAILNYQGRIDISNSLTMVGTIVAPKTDLRITGNIKIQGNIWAERLFVGNSSEVRGLAYAPNGETHVSGNSTVRGAVIAQTVKLSGSSKIIKDGFQDFDLDDQETPSGPDEPEEPDEPEKPAIPCNLHAGLLGEYYDASEFTNKSALRFRRIDDSVAFNFMTGSPAPEIEPESFAIRWTGYIIPPKTGNYRFKTYSDDGVRVWINGQKVIDNWGLFSLEFTIADKTIALEAGKAYPIKVEYQQLPVFSAMFLFWEAEQVPMQVIPQNVYYVDQCTYDKYRQTQYYNPISGTGHGLRNAFYDISDDGNDFTKRYQEVSEVDYRWGTGAPMGVTGDAFRATMDGYIEPRFTEKLTLSFCIDDAVRVWIDNQVVLDAWSGHSDEIESCTIDAVAGQKRKIRIEYADFGGGAGCQMRWSSACQEQQVVPAKFLYEGAGSGPTPDPTTKPDDPLKVLENNIAKIMNDANVKQYFDDIGSVFDMDSTEVNYGLKAHQSIADSIGISVSDFDFQISYDFFEDQYYVYLFNSLDNEGVGNTISVKRYTWDDQAQQVVKTDSGTAVVDEKYGIDIKTGDVSIYKALRTWSFVAG